MLSSSGRGLEGWGLVLRVGECGVAKPPVYFYPTTPSVRPPTHTRTTTLPPSVDAPEIELGERSVSPSEGASSGAVSVGTGVTPMLLASPVGAVSAPKGPHAVVGDKRLKATGVMTALAIGLHK